VESAFFIGLLFVLMSLWKFFFPDLYRTWDSILGPSRQVSVVNRIERRLAKGQPISPRMGGELHRLVTLADRQKPYEKKLRELHASLAVAPTEQR